MPWWITLVTTLGVPALKALLRPILKGLELKYPGIAPLVDEILKFIDGGGTAETIRAHVQQQCEGLICPADVKK